MSDQIEAWGRLGVWSRSVGARTPPSPSLPPPGPRAPPPSPPPPHRRFASRSTITFTRCGVKG